MNSLTVDARHAFCSGIGIYTTTVVPATLGHLNDASVNVILPPQASIPLLLEKEVRTFHSGIRMYSPWEQLALPLSVPGSDVFWATHYACPMAVTAKLVVTVHDLIHLAIPEYRNRPHIRLYAKTLFQLIRLRAQKVICVSKFTADELIKYSGIDPRKLEVVHHGVAPQWFEPLERSSPHHRPFFLAVGNIKPHKNFPRLIRAFRDVVSTHGETDLILVGNLEGMHTVDPSVLKMINETPQIIHRSNLSFEELRAHYQYAKAVIFPTLYEGFGYPSIEAFASHTPLIASNAPPIPEICGEAALYFDPTDIADIKNKIIRFLDSPSLQDELSDKGQERAEEFTLEKTAKANAAILTSLF